MLQANYWLRKMSNVIKIPDIVIRKDNTARLNTYDARYWYYTSTNARNVVDCYYSSEDFQFPAVVKLPDNIMDRFEIILESSGDGLTIVLQGEPEPIAFKLLEKLQHDLRLEIIDENNLIEYVFAPY
jgi:hypothetical protein